MDGNLLLALVPAGIGLFGVWLGAYLTGIREQRREKARMDQESAYLATLVVAHLDRLVNDCLQVCFDDGTCEGQPAGHDGLCHEITVPMPKFDPLALKVDWKALPISLMFGVLNLPYKIDQIEVLIRSVAEFDSPPDYSETFWTRQHEYAVLGLEVSELANILRLHAGLPAGSASVSSETATREDMLRSQRDKALKCKADYEVHLRSAVPTYGNA